MQLVAIVVFLIYHTHAVIACADEAEPSAQQQAKANDSELGRFTTRREEFSDLVDSARENRSTPMKLHMPVGKGPFPVVVLSHGAGGNWDSNFAQANHLASHGYAVICLEHVGSNTNGIFARGARIGQAVAAMTCDADEVLNRPRDVHFAIDQASRWNRSHPKVRGRLDLSRIAVMGHSFGAYTTLVVCGARPALDWLKPTVGAGSGLGPDLFDKRVRCGVALSPQGPGEPFFLPESYRSIRVPLLGITGSRDKQQHAQPIHRKRSFELWPRGDRFLLWIENANHLSFSDPTGSRRFERANRATGLREDVQAVSRAATLQFFDHYLRKSSTEAIDEARLRPYVRGRVRSIEFLKRN